jgi:hypothetical protein
MPACLTFDSGTHLFAASAGQYDHAACESTTGMPFLVPKRFVATLHSVLDQHQILTPSASSESPTYSPFDYIPYELLDHILGAVHGDTTRRIYDVLRDVSSCCLVSRQFYTVAINWLYRHVPISDPYAFTKVAFARFKY